MRKKGMWGGDLALVEGAHLAAFPGRGVAPTEEPHSPALFTALNEILVNACDQAKATAGRPGGTKRIDVSFDAETGEVVVRNDGPGIPVALRPAESEAAGRPVYSVEVLFACALAGTNITKSINNVKGGINGLGAKLANVHSARFRVETLDGPARLEYSQAFADRLRVVEPPQIREAPRGAAPFTRVTFTPDYRALGYAAAPPPPAQAAEVGAWLRFRALQTAAYLGARVEVSFNGEACAVEGAAGLARLLAEGEGEAPPPGPDGEAPPPARVFGGAARAKEPPYQQHPWDVAVVVLPPGVRAARRLDERDVGVVNGVHCSRGSHIRYVREALAEEVGSRLAALQKKGKGEKPPPASTLLASVRVVFCGAVPGVDWGSQAKGELRLPEKILKNWALPQKALKEAAAAAAEGLLGAGARRRAPAFVHDKYTPAAQASRAKRAKTRLLAAEGDSAITLLRTGLTQHRGGLPPGGPSLEWCGIISLQGVVMNAARQVQDVALAGGATLKVASARLDSNRRLAALADALGLDPRKSYSTAEERAGLHYGQVVLCVDQDHDGVGKIASLVLVWFHTFWPALLRAGYVGQLLTPVIRAYPRRGGGPPAEFFQEAAFEAWLEAEPGRRESHRVKYYKGLAAHDSTETAAMFEPGRFERSIHTYTYDELTDELMKGFFGRETAFRKAALAAPARRLDAAAWRALEARREIPLGRVQLAQYTADYKLAAIGRQIPGAVDGLIPVHRKVVEGARRLYAGYEATTKIFQLGGYVAHLLYYHHGDQSINESIVKLAQSFPGARRYPLLRGVGQFGSRHDPKSAGSPRYISVGRSRYADYAFPEADSWLLPRVQVEGASAEPAYFVPVVPLGVLDSFEIVSEGWNHAHFARALGPALAAARAFVGGDPRLLALGAHLHARGVTPTALALAAGAAAAWPLPAETRGFRGAVAPYRGAEASFGAYRWHPGVGPGGSVEVLDLPIGVSTLAYLKALHDSPYVLGVEDRSCGEEVRLWVALQPEAAPRILELEGDAEADPFEKALHLVESLAPALNYVGVDGRVLEFPPGPPGYACAVAYWGVVRREAYRRRLERELALVELRAELEAAVLRFIGEAREVDLARRADPAAAAAELARRGFPLFDSGLLDAPGAADAAGLRARASAPPRASYGYIFHLKAGDLLASAAATRRRRLEALLARAAELRADLAEAVPGASVWLAEIAKFEAFALSQPPGGLPSDHTRHSADAGARARSPSPPPPEADWLPPEAGESPPEAGESPPEPAA
jgi:DNA topoisomerase-2